MRADNSILHLLKSVPVLGTEDTIKRAAGLIQASEGSSVFVRNNGFVSGIVTEQSIAEAIATEEDCGESPECIIGSLEMQPAAVLHPSMNFRQAAAAFGGSDSDVLPVVDDNGAFLGGVYRSDVVCMLTGNLRPASVGGMATPLGVFLTTGSHNGGAGPLGLMLTGASLRIFIAVASLAVYGLMQVFAYLTGIRVDLMLGSVPLQSVPNMYDLPYYLVPVLSGAIFMLLLRFSSLSGYHAAEHMTVSAIEAGEALTPEVVRHMPRVHPRCGSNLLAIGGIFIIIAGSLGSEAAVLVAMLVIILGWRKIGGLLQYLVTTSDPSDKQLASGIAAGQEVMDKFQANPGYQSYGFQRIWNMGFLQTLAGMAVVSGLLWLLQQLFNMPVFI